MGRPTSTLAALSTGLAAVALALALPGVAGATNGRVALVNSGNLILQAQSGPVATLPGRAAGIVGGSRGGKVLVTSSGADGDITVTDAKGKVVRQFNLAGIAIHSLDVSTDGRRIALTAFRDADPVPGHIYPYVLNVNGSGLRRLKTSLRYTYDLRFVGHGTTTLAYAGAPSAGPYVGCASLRRVKVDGSGDRELYGAVGGNTPCVVNFAISPGGGAAALIGDPAPGLASTPGQPRTALYRVTLDDKSVPKLLDAETFAVAWSPDGDQLAFSTTAGTFRTGLRGGSQTLLTAVPTLSLFWLKASS